MLTEFFNVSYRHLHMMVCWTYETLRMNEYYNTSNILGTAVFILLWSSCMEIGTVVIMHDFVITHRPVLPFSRWNIIQFYYTMLNSFDINDFYTFTKWINDSRIIIKSFWCNSFWTLLHTQKNIFVNFVHNCGIKKLVFSLMHIFFLTIVCKAK